MFKYIPRVRDLVAAPLVFAVVGIAACKSDKAPDTLAQDSTLNRDIQLANRDSAAQPQLQDVPSTTTPAPAPATTTRTTTSTTRRSTTPAPAPRPTPRPTPPPRTTAPARTTTTTASGNTVTRTPGASESALGTIASGTSLALSSNARVCTNTNHVGDRVTASTTQSVSGSNGAVIPAGATATLEITSLKRSENINDKIDMGFRVLSITFGGHTYPVTATVASAQVDRVKNQPGSKDAQKVATGAAVGAILGQILGKSTKSTVIGGAVGAAAGAGAAATTSNYEGCVPDGGNITVTLDSPVQVHV